ncbi:MAG: hypothetical protein INH41_03850 [Myxococcaceae bacterium]|nr:hypothetical protein [Myxococcaceae bacterium]MCA3011514.1 hypothetical protein [Myxococcaceae bacterium]
MLLLLHGCARARQPVSIGAISATVPADFVPMAPERIARLREAALSTDPSVDVAMVGRKPPGEPLPWMYLQRAELSPSVSAPITVGALLERTVTELRATLREGGLEVQRATTTTVGDTLELCSVTRPSPTSAKGAPVSSFSCARLWVSAASRKVHTASVVCLSLEAEPDECERIVGSRALTPGDAANLDATY